MKWEKIFYPKTKGPLFGGFRVVEQSRALHRISAKANQYFMNNQKCFLMFGFSISALSWTSPPNFLPKYNVSMQC